MKLILNKKEMSAFESALKIFLNSNSKEDYLDQFCMGKNSLVRIDRGVDFNKIHIAPDLFISMIETKKDLILLFKNWILETTIVIDKSSARFTEFLNFKKGA